MDYFDLESYSTDIMNEINRLKYEDHLDHNTAVEVAKASALLHIADKCSDINMTLEGIFTQGIG